MSHPKNGPFPIQIVLLLPFLKEELSKVGKRGVIL